MRTKGFRAEKHLEMGPSISLRKEVDKGRTGEEEEKAAWHRGDSPSLATSGVCATCRDGVPPATDLKATDAYL